MRLTIATEEGSTFNIDVDSSMELENVMALLEAEVSKTSTKFEHSRSFLYWKLYSIHSPKGRKADLITSCFVFFNSTVWDPNWRSTIILLWSTTYWCEGDNRGVLIISSQLSSKAYVAIY